MDAAITGDPLWSMHMTDASSENLYGRYSRLDNLSHAGTDLLQIAAPFALLAWPLSFTRRVREQAASMRLVWCLLLVSGGMFLLLVGLGMPSSERYLLLPTCLVAVLAGVVAASWRQFAGGLVVALMAVLMLGTLIRADGLLHVRDELRPHVEWTGEIRELATRPEVRRMLARCPHAALPNPIVYSWAFWGDRPLQRWQTDEQGTTRPDIYIAPAPGNVAATLLTRPRFDDDAGFVVPPGLVAGPSTAAWRLHVSPISACVAAA